MKKSRLESCNASHFHGKHFEKKDPFYYTHKKFSFMHSLHVFYSPTFGDARKTEGLSLNRADFSQIGPFLPVFTPKLLQKLFKLLENVKEDSFYKVLENT